MLQRQAGLLRTFRREGRRMLVLNRVFQSVLKVLTALGTALAFGLGAYLFRQGAISLGTVFMISYYTGLLAENLGELTPQLNDLQGADAGIARLAELYHARTPIQDGPGAALPVGPPALTVDRVVFGYDDAGPVLHEVSFRLEAGQILGVLGRTGSGKATLLRVLLGLLPAQAGEIRWNGQPVQDPGSFFLPPRGGYVPQAPHLFSDSLEGNTLPATEHEIAGAIRQAVLERDLAGLAAGLASLVGPRGVRFSAGQVQRVSAARACVRQVERNIA